MTIDCPTCGRAFDVKPYRIRRAKSGLVFCSPGCSARHAVVRESKAAPQRTAVVRECPVCGASFTRVPSELRDVNYCSVSCSAKANMTLPPIPKGTRRAPSTEFRRGHRPSNRLPVGSVTIRTRTRDEGPRAWVKVAEPNSWRPRAVVAWEKANGAVPAGRVIHHVDRDTLNDDPTNLVALTRSEHAREHTAETHSRTP